MCSEPTFSPSLNSSSESGPIVRSVFRCQGPVGSDTGETLLAPRLFCCETTFEEI